MAEREGFEPPVPCEITGFQDQLHKPLGHLSVAYVIITKQYPFVNTKLKFYIYSCVKASMIGYTKSKVKSDSSLAVKGKGGDFRVSEKILPDLDSGLCDIIY